LQEFPISSPLDLVKEELKKDYSEIKGVVFFSDEKELSKEQIKQIKEDQKDEKELSKEQINQIKEDQKNVVRLAVKKRLA